MAVSLHKIGLKILCLVNKYKLYVWTLFDKFTYVHALKVLEFAFFSEKQTIYRIFIDVRYLSLG